MNLEQQVCSLDLSKRLKELGVKQESIWYWGRIENTWLILFRTELNSFISVSGLSHIRQSLNEVYSAFTVAELGEMLPLYVSVPDEKADYNTQTLSLMFWKQNNISHICEYQVCPHKTSSKEEFCVKYYCSSRRSGHPMEKYVKADTEADARAKLLCYLLENKLLNLE